jgi:hypothetical protein
VCSSFALRPLAGVAFAAGAGPLLAAARAAQAAARAAGAPVVRLGLPGGRAALPGRLRPADVRRRLAERAPGVRLEVVALPFPAMYRALLDGAVDVLWGAIGPAPAPLALAPAGVFDRMAVFPAGHRLAEADRLAAADLVDLPLLCDPAVPPGWMAPLPSLRPACRPARRPAALPPRDRPPARRPPRAGARPGRQRARRARRPAGAPTRVVDRAANRSSRPTPAHSRGHGRRPDGLLLTRRPASGARPARNGAGGTPASR